MPIRASAYSTEITPEPGVPLAGFPGKQRVSTGVKDPLLVSALHLRGGSGGILLLSLDLAGMDPAMYQMIRRRISEATGTREANIFIGVSGTHSGPHVSQSLQLLNDRSRSEPDPEYLDIIVEKAVRAAAETAGTSRPATAALVSLDKPGSGMLLILGVQGRVTGLAIWYPALPSLLGADNMEISADFVAVLRQKLAARFGAQPVVAYFCSGSGDSLLCASDSGQSAAAFGESLATQIVEKVKALAPSDWLSQLALGGKIVEVPALPRKLLPDIMTAGGMFANALKMNSESSLVGMTISQRKAARWSMMESTRVMGLIMAQKRGLLDGAAAQYEPVRLHAMQIGPAKIISLPGSVSSECAADIALIGGGQTWVSEAVDGDLFGSLLVRHEQQADGHALLSAMYDSDAGPKLIQAVRTLCETATP